MLRRKEVGFSISYRLDDPKKNSTHPIVRVDWNDAQAYCEWSGGRLPTEAEWEYAAREGQQGMIYPGGNQLSVENAKYDSGDGTVPVRSYEPNGFGFYDMAGNVWEWCADWFAEDYYESSPRQDPFRSRQATSMGTATWISFWDRKREAGSMGRRELASFSTE